MSTTPRRSNEFARRFFKRGMRGSSSAGPTWHKARMRWAHIIEKKRKWQAFLEDPRWRRVMQEHTTNPIVGGALEFDDNGVLQGRELPRQEALSSTATTAEIVAAINELNRQLREKGYQA